MSETIECSLSQLEAPIIQLLTSSLAPNEQPLICVKYKRGSEYRVYVIAESRIISLQRTMVLGVAIPPNIHTVFIDDIAGFTRQDGSPYNNIHFQTRSNQSVEFIFESRQVADKFVSVFQEVFARSKTKTDAPGRLRQLAQLHKEGLISDSEFEQKRKDILGQL